MENKIRSCGKDLRDYVSRLAIGFECSVIQYFFYGLFFLIEKKVACLLSACAKG